MARKPWLWSNGTQERRGVKSASSHLHVIRLLYQTTLARPVVLENGDHALEGLYIRLRCSVVHDGKLARLDVDKSIRADSVLSMAALRNVDLMLRARPLSYVSL